MRYKATFLKSMCKLCDNISNMDICRGRRFEKLVATHEVTSIHSHSSKPTIHNANEGYTVLPCTLSHLGNIHIVFFFNSGYLSEIETNIEVMCDKTVGCI